jgi:hypothetical protein
MRFIHSIPLRVHGWGGLGSQLYALSMVFDLKVKYPIRRIKLVLHTGGVTKRLSELDFIRDIDFEILQINDFYTQDKSYKNQDNLIKVRLKSLLTKIVYSLNFLVSANSNLDFNKVRPWTVSIRGHYFNRTVSTEFYSYLLKHIDLEEKHPNLSQIKIAIHYRMGDLLTLTEKSISPANKIIDAIKQVQKMHNNLKIYVYSDSPQIAKETLSNAGLTDEFGVSDLPTIDLIRACVGANFFIGTGSKVSLWIVNIRRYMGKIDNNFLEGFDDKLYNRP